MSQKQVTIDTAMAEVSIAIDHLGAGVRQLLSINKQQPIDGASIEQLRDLESLATKWLIAMEDVYMDLPSI